NASAHYVPQNSTPCPTLFVANLAPTCAEPELIEVFSRCPGFLKLKMQNKNGAPVAFVDFQNASAHYVPQNSTPCPTTALCY
ncbi:RNA-binding (RRM/RBD/RNP motifs) family protein, partial [Thalictrum thalictroides]